MPKTRVDISVSLDGYVAGPNPSLEDPLGEGGELLHEWAVVLKSWRDRHGLEGGEVTPSDEVLAEQINATGATVMGRKMYSGGSGSWDDDPRASGWWGDDPPYHHPVFVVTHHARDPLPMKGGTTFNFVTDGIESAIAQARAVAGDKDVLIAGGADVVQQGVRAGLVETVQVHIAPVFLGSGTRLFDGLPHGMRVEPINVVASPTVTHVTYRLK